MYLEINGERLVSDLQQEFHALYPYLKIEFFRNGAVRRDRYPVHHMIQGTQPIKQAWYSRKEEGPLAVTDNMTVTDFENALLDQFGLSAQVFRRSGNLWLETTLTDYWTLRQQNEHGREITVAHNRMGNG